MTRTGHNNKDTSTFIVRCGEHGLFLGIGSKPRAGSLELARRCTNRPEAEVEAETLRARCRTFELPWQVQEILS